MVLSKIFGNPLEWKKMVLEKKYGSERTTRHDENMEK